MTEVAMRGRAGCLILMAVLATSSHAQELRQDVRKLATIATPVRIHRVSVCGSTGLAAGLGAKGSVYVWRLPSGETVSNPPAEDGLTALDCSADGKWLAGGKRDGSVLIADTSGKSVRTLAVGSERVNELKFSPDGSLLAVRVAGAPVRLWNPVRGTLVAELKTDFGGSTSMAFSPDSSLFATANGDTAVRIYDRNGKLKLTYSGLLLEPFAIGFLDAKQIVVGGADSMLTILDASDAHVVRQLPKQSDPIFEVAVLSDGTSLCSLQIDAMGLKKFTTSLWDLRTGSQRELAVDGHHIVGFGSTLGHKGLLFTADSDSTLTAWELAN
jgi:WD40 repeat protein